MVWLIDQCGRMRMKCRHDVESSLTLNLVASSNFPIKANLSPQNGYSDAGHGKNERFRVQALALLLFGYRQADSRENFSKLMHLTMPVWHWKRKALTSASYARRRCSWRGAPKHRPIRPSANHQQRRRRQSFQ